MTYDEEFSSAMKTKLKLNRQIREDKKEESRIHNTKLDAIREQIVKDTQRRHPNATREEILAGLEAMGF